MRVPLLLRRHAPRAAFTLPELVLALLLLSVVAALAIPAFFERQEITLENAARILTRDLRSAQNTAAWRNVWVGLRFDEDGEGYTTVELPEGPGGPAIELEGRRFSRDAVFEGVWVGFVAFGEDRTIAYDERGHPSEDGSVQLLFKGDARVLMVDTPSGRISVRAIDRHERSLPREH